MADFPTFESFAEEAWGIRAYPWQSRLAAQLRQGDIPELVDVPTGLGKGTALAAAVWALAGQIDDGGHRTLPQRIVHAVDRRRVVDDTHDPISRLNSRLVEARSGPLVRVREALRKLAGPWGDPLAVQRIHGEAPDIGAWLRPTGAVVLGMTPQQLCTRLLFRGLGVSERTRSIHAGLLGVDTLIVLDEPHLSHQAIDTIRTILELQRRATNELGVPRARLMLLGATIPDELRDRSNAQRTTLSLSAADHADPSVRLRLDGIKRVHLLESKRSLASDLVAQAQHLASTDDDRRVAIMVNSVKLAREVLTGLQKKSLDATLVTSRLRGTERAGQRLDTARIVVATQTLEVGVDISFDAMVTEACPYPVLVQRLGRLQRTSPVRGGVAVFVVPSKPSPATSAVYGEESVQATVDYLKTLADADGYVDFSLGSQLSRRNGVPAECSPSPARCATFHAGYLPTMATTYPTPFSDFPVQAFVSGPDALESTEVLVAWRSQPELSVGVGADVLPGEQVAVPIGAVRAFLAGRGNSANDVADVPSSQRNVAPSDVVVWAWARRGDRWVQLRRTGDVRPGDSLLIDSEAGGYVSAVGWDAASSQHVPDHSLVAADSRRTAGALYRSVPRVPLTAGSLAAFNDYGHRKTPDNLDVILDAITQRWDEFTPEDADSFMDELGLEGGWQLSVTDGHIFASYPTAAERDHRANAAAGRAVTLAQHSADVAETVEQAGATAGLRREILEEICQAALRHDDGKSHPQFQRYLGNVDCGLPLAKSARGSVSRAAERRHADLAGHDPGWRHEGLSRDRALQVGADELVVHLVGSHHGRGRPLLNSRAVGVGQDEDLRSAKRFQDLNVTYGPWGLAYLEALLRLSDWWASAHPGRGGQRSGQHSDDGGSPKGDQPQRDVNLSVTRLEGLVASPMTGWFAAVGLLRTATDLGDQNAALRWPGDDALGCPELRSTIAIEDIVIAAVGSTLWARLWDESAKLASGFDVKFQKIGGAPDIRRLLKALTTADDDLARALAQDVWLEGTGFALTIPARANQSSYVAVARSVLSGERGDSDVGQAVLEALVDPSKGYVDTQCDGGMDRLIDGGLTGRERAGGRLVRAMLSPLALLGMASLGAGGQAGVTVDYVTGRECRQPIPSDFVDFATVRALAQSAGLSGVKFPLSIYHAVTVGKEIVWQPGPAERK